MRCKEPRTRHIIEDAVREFCRTDQQEIWLRNTFELVHSDGRLSGIESCSEMLQTSAVVTLIENMRKELLGETKVDS